MSPANLIGIAGYGTAAFLFATFAVLLATVWRGRAQGALLTIAVSASAVWAAVLAVHAGWNDVSVRWIWVFEGLRDLAWTWFLLELLEPWPRNVRAFRGTFQWLRFLALGAAALSMVPMGDAMGHDTLLGGREVSTLSAVPHLFLPAAVLVLIEQLYRNTAQQHLPRLKLFYLSIGGLFAYDFYFFADALLFGRLDLNIWLARGAANSLVVPLIAFSTARAQPWSWELVVSRKVVFHASVLIGVGLYLSVIALGAYYIRLYGGKWSPALQPVLFSAAVVAGVILLLSNDLRSRFKVLVDKHFFQHKYDYREEWLHLISILSGDALHATVSERIVFALGRLVDSPGGSLWLCNGHGGCEHERSWNLSDERSSNSEDFSDLLAFLAARRWIVSLDELRSNPGVYQGLTVPASLTEAKHLWLIVPLLHEDGLLGFATLSRPRTPQQLNWETLDLLKTAATQAASYLAFEQAAKALADARQFEGFNRLSAFVVHDLKNVIAQLSLVARNAERHKRNPVFMEDAIATVRNSVERMRRLLTQLRGATPGNGQDRVKLGEAVRLAVAESESRSPRPVFMAETTGDSIVYADRDRLVAVIDHIIQNAQEATPATGGVSVRLIEKDQQASIEISDDGVGMEAAFIRERLFRPFDSTKGLSGMGIGAYECREFVQSLGGRVEVSSSPGKGTRFVIILPTEDSVGECRSFGTVLG